MCGVVRKPKFKAGDKVRVTRDGGKVKPRLAGRTGVVIANRREDTKLGYYDVKVKLNGNTRASVYDEGFFTKVRGKK